MKLRLILLTMMLLFTFDKALASDDLGKSPKRTTAPTAIVQYDPDISEAFQKTAVMHFTFDGLHAVINRLLPALSTDTKSLSEGIGQLLQYPRFALLAVCLYSAGQYAVNTKSRLGFVFASSFIVHALGDVDDLITYPKTDIYVAVCVGLTFIAIMNVLFGKDQPSLNEYGAMGKPKGMDKNLSGTGKR